MSTLIDSHLVGQSIKHLRLSRNWTQDRLATTAGYSVRNLRRIENDGTTSIDVVNTFADIFDVSALDILSGDVFYFQTKMGLAHLCAFWALPINPITNKGCISDDLLDREIYSISAGYNSKFNIYVCNKKDDEELIKKATSIGLIEDVNNDDSNDEDDF